MAFHLRASSSWGILHPSTIGIVLVQAIMCCPYSEYKYITNKCAELKFNEPIALLNTTLFFIFESMGVGWEILAPSLCYIVRGRGFLSYRLHEACEEYLSSGRSILIYVVVQDMFLGRFIFSLEYILHISVFAIVITVYNCPKYRVL
jgi:hypothetical protein